MTQRQSGKTRALIIATLACGTSGVICYLYIHSITSLPTNNLAQVSGISDKTDSIAHVGVKTINTIPEFQDSLTHNRCILFLFSGNSIECVKSDFKFSELANHWKTLDAPPIQFIRIDFTNPNGPLWDKVMEWMHSESVPEGGLNLLSALHSDNFSLICQPRFVLNGAQAWRLPAWAWSSIVRLRCAQAMSRTAQRCVKNIFENSLLT